MGVGVGGCGGGGGSGLGESLAVLVMQKHSILSGACPPSTGAGFSVSSQENLDPPLVEDSRQKEACCFSVERGLDPPIQTIDQ